MGVKHMLGRYGETVDWIAWTPDLFPKKIGTVQRAIIKQTYFVVYFLQEETRTLVLAVLDGRMEPKNIRGRLIGRRHKARRKARE